MQEEIGIFSTSSESSRVGRVAFLVCTTVIAWLVATLGFINIEFDDGYSTILNSQHFLGITSDYYWQRGPLMAWILMPAEWMANALALHPIDVRIHHLTMIALHGWYLLAVWRLLISHHGKRWTVLLAFLAAVPSVLFFSYAPFVSHDLFPGLVLLWMLFRAHAYLSQPSAAAWWLLTFIGAAVVLVKQTYAAFWVAVLLVQFAALPAGDARSVWLARWLRLLAGAIVSAIIAWSGYAWALSSTFPEYAFLIRPWIQAQAMLEIYTQAEGPIAGMFYQWVYLRNFAAYGVLATILLVPGLWLSLRRSDPFLRTVAVAWIGLLVLMLCIPFKEVRYLGFLAPLTAFVIVPVIDELAKSRKYLASGLVLVLSVDIWSVANEAWRVTDSYYRTRVADFLRELPVNPPSSPVYFFGRLSFIDQRHPAFFGDRYHRITHLIPEQVRDLYGYPPELARKVNDLGVLRAGDIVPGQILVFSNDVAARIPPIRADNATILLPQFSQFLAVAEIMELQLEGINYRFKDNRDSLVIMIPYLPPGSASMTFDASEVSRIHGLERPTEKLIINGFRVHSLCRIDECRRLPD